MPSDTLLMPRPWKTRLALPCVAFGLLLLAWELLARFAGWSTDVFPGPLKVFASMGELIANGTLLKHNVASLFRVKVGFYLAVLILLNNNLWFFWGASLSASCWAAGKMRAC